MLPGGLISFGDLEIVVSERKITFLYSNDRLYISRLAGKRLHNMRNPKSLPVLLGVIAAGADRRHLGPFRIRQLLINSHPLFPEEIRIGCRSTVERVVVCAQLPFEESPGQRFRIGFAPSCTPCDEDPGAAGECRPCTRPSRRPIPWSLRPL